MCSKPVEVTTHNLHFHENSGILSLDYCENLIATSGYDKSIRLWEINLTAINSLYTENCYKTAANSSIRIGFYREFTNFKGIVNCVRFYRGNDLESGFYRIAASDDTGRVILIIINGETANYKVIHEGEGNSCYDLSWINKNELALCFDSGKIKILKIEEKILKKIKYQTVLEKEIHNSIIQGISICKKTKRIATFSLDKTLKISLLNNLEIFSVLTADLDLTHGIFKRILIDDNLLYVPTKRKTLSIFVYPFKPENLHMKLGPFNAPVVKILKNEEFLVVVTKKSIYILKDYKKQVYVDNVAFKEVTDAFIDDKIIFYSSMDGFLGSIRLQD
ncbi:hypothetical protein NUSPORA_01930 [Nucleospora cyclopteri]